MFEVVALSLDDQHGGPPANDGAYECVLAELCHATTCASISGSEKKSAGGTGWRYSFDALP